ncbi:hypothetical protein [Thalassoglobus sp.]|uniref:hypothetical protein n=1 Tax=Thalassoglobus sp. TaxID=2795869 RepID=UPI003AA9D387
MLKKMNLLLALTVACWFSGCGGEEPVTPAPAPAGNDAPAEGPETELEEGGANAALPADQQVED